VEAGTVGESITLNGAQVELDSDLGRSFITDATRAAESVIDDATLMEKYELSIEELQVIANTKAVGRAIRKERELRLRSGVATKELAAKSYFKVPTVLDSILMNEQMSGRNRIESARELRVIATPENQTNPAVQSERFLIRIDLTASGDGEVFEKEIVLTNNTDFDEQPKLTTPAKLIIDNDEKYDG
jgi:hypothetical protein